MHTLKRKLNKQPIFTPRQKRESRPNSELEEGVKTVKFSSQINVQKRKTKEINFKQKLLQTGQQK